MKISHNLLFATALCLLSPLSQSFSRGKKTFFRKSVLKLGGIPSGQPLHFIQPTSLLEFAYDTLKDATVPGDLDTFIAIVVAESLSGVLGGLASRGIAGVIGDKKRDNAILKGASSGAFFGLSSILRTAFTLLGIPRPIGITFATLFSTGFSEVVKIFGRLFSERSTQDYKDNFVQNNINMSEATISRSELYSDISKWVLFDTLKSSATEIPTEVLVQCEYAFLFGWISGFVGTYIRESINAKSNIPFLIMPKLDLPNTTINNCEIVSCVENTDSNGSISLSLEPPPRPTLDRVVLLRLLYGSIEGGVLFTAYQCSLSALQGVVPSQFGSMRFPFSTFLDQLEEKANTILSR